MEDGHVAAPPSRAKSVRRPCGPSEFTKREAGTFSKTHDLGPADYLDPEYPTLSRISNVDIAEQ